MNAHKVLPYSSTSSVLNDSMWIVIDIDWGSAPLHAPPGVVVLSWYPPGVADEHGEPSEDLVPAVMDAAHRHHIKVTGERSLYPILIAWLRTGCDVMTLIDLRYSAAHTDFLLHKCHCHEPNCSISLLSCTLSRQLVKDAQYLFCSLYSLAISVMWHPKWLTQGRHAFSSVQQCMLNQWM